MDKNIIVSKITKWCAYQERSEYETIQKLLSMGVDKKAIEEIIQYLKDENYLNEKRFVSTFINGKINIKKWGVEKIKQYLKQKHHIADETIHQYIQDIDKEKYLQQLQHIILKKKQFIETKEKDKHLLRKKIINFALSKGYNLDEIIETLKQLNI